MSRDLVELLKRAEESVNVPMQASDAAGLREELLDAIASLAAPVVSLGFGMTDSYAALQLDSMLGELLRHDADETHSRVRALRLAIARLSAPVVAGPVAWQYRTFDEFGKNYVGWQDWSNEDRPEKIGRWRVEYRPLYTHPNANGEVTETQVERFAQKYWGSDWGTAHGCHTTGQMNHERANIRDALQAALRSQP